MKLNETESQFRAARLKYIDTRWEQLNGLSKEAGDNYMQTLIDIERGK